jgi:hypothetical protein
MDSSPQTTPSPDKVREILQRAVRAVGSQTRLGKKCGCSQQNISRALATGIVSIELAMLLARVLKSHNVRVRWQDLASEPRIAVD